MLKWSIAFLLCISFIAGMVLHSLPTALAAPVAPHPNTEIVLAVNYDGTAPFGADPTYASNTDGQHTAGLDQDGNNNVVRTYDLISYRVDWNVNEVDATGTTVEMILPAAIPEVVWKEIPAGCDSATSTITNNDQTLTCDLGDRREGSSGTFNAVAEVAGTRVGIDGDVISLTADISTNQSGVVTSNSVSTTISGAPSYDWVKGHPIEYTNITRTVDSKVGRVFVYPLILRPGDDDRGVAPLDDTADIEIFDHLSYWSANGGSTLNATLITTTNGYAGNFDNRVCGGYDGDGTEEERDLNNTSSNLPLYIPNGVNGNGNSTNTTAGADANTESVICTDVTGGNSYPIARVNISGHNTQTTANSAANGAGNNGIVVAVQVAYFITEEELFPLAGGNGYLHNAITGDTTAISAPASPFNVPSNVTTSIGVAGASTGTETTTANNAVATQIAYIPEVPGTAAYRHWIQIVKGPYQQIEIVDPSSGTAFSGMDERLMTDGGLGRNGAYDLDNLTQYQFSALVARDQLLTVELGVRTTQSSVSYADAHREAIHGCAYIDTAHMELIDFPNSFDLHSVSTFGSNASTLSSRTGTPSHGFAHLLYGDAGRTIENKANQLDIVRLNPSFVPNFEIQVAKAATNVGKAYDRGMVQCDADDADSALGWVTVTPATNLSAFDPNNDGRYEDIELVRVRTLEPVPWFAPFTSVVDLELGEHVAPVFGAGFNLYLQAQVRDNVTDAPDGADIFVHAARARGDWDGNSAPQNLQCTRPEVGGILTSYNNPTTGWCNLATTPPPSIAGAPDPIERLDTNNRESLSHRDTVIVAGPKLSVKKTNINGLADIVRNGDEVTFQIDVSVTGAPLIDDEITDITLTDVLIANFEFVSLTQPTDGTCTGGSTITCTFGDRIAPWNDSYTITVRVKDAGADQTLENTVEAEGTNGGVTTTRYSTAYAYTPGPYHHLEIRHEVEDLDGDCTRPPGVTAHVPGDCSVTDIDGQMIFTIHYTNTGNVDLENIEVINVLPHIADTIEPQTNFSSSTGLPLPTNAISLTLGDGRTPPSAFSGSISLVSATDSNGFLIEHTTDTIATIDRNPDTNTSNWSTGTPANATGLKMTIDTLSIGMTGTMTLVYDTLGNVNDDIYTSNFGAQAFGSSPIARSYSGSGGSGAIYVGNRSNDVSVMVLEVMVGSTVWNDVNNNGIQDSGENGIGGVTVELYDPGPDGVIGGGDDVLIITTTTSSTAGSIGDYLFDELHPGDYYVSIPTPPAGLPDSSTPTSTADDGVDDDDNGDQPAGSGGATYSPIITLEPQTEPTLATGETEQGNTLDDQDDASGDMTIDFGFLNSVEIGSHVWIETDGDGDISNGSPTPVVGTVVTAIDGAGNVYTSTTDAAGQYTITVPANATYTVTVGTPSGHAPSGNLVGSSSSPTDPDGMSHDPAGTVVTVGTEDNYTIDFGFKPELRLGGLLWEDNNNNEGADVGEGHTTFAGVQVNLYDINGTLVTTTTTDANGEYLFEGLEQGEYQVRIPDTATNQAAFDGYSSSTGSDGVDGQVDPDNDADNDDNGYDDSATGFLFSSLPISLTTSIEATGETDGIDSSNDESDADAIDGTTPAYVDGNSNLTVDFGFIPELRLGGLLWEDNNNNELADTADGHTAFAGVQVNLYDINGTLVATTTTDANGEYLFEGLEQGEYQVRIPDTATNQVAFDGYVSSSGSNGVDGQVDPDNDADNDDNGYADSATGFLFSSLPISLTTSIEATGETDGIDNSNDESEADAVDGTTPAYTDGNSNLTVDLGFVPLLSLGSTLFYDNNNDGIQAGVNETGIPTITVELLDSSGSVISTTTTDANGNYIFENLLPGQYRVQVPNPPSDAPLSSTTTNTADDNTDGDDNGDQPGGSGTNTISPLITLAPNTEPSGTAEGAQGNTQDDALDDDNGDMTVDFGFVPPLSIGSTLFYDKNNDGVQTVANEGGIVGVIVELLDASGVVTATTTTDSSGNYVFDNLLPGDYQVRVPTPPSDAPLSSTPTSTSDDNVDGNDDGDQPGGYGTAVTSPVITLAVGSEPAGEPEQGGGLGSAEDTNGNMTIDFGFTDYVSLGSTLFYDNDNDGMQGTGETGIGSIVVELLNITGTVLMTTTTDLNGDYLFDELMPGNYQVRVPTAPSDAPNSSTPTDLADNQQDGDDNGSQLGGTGAATISPVISLVVDDEPTAAETAQASTQDDALDDDNGDMTVDFGFVPPLSLGSTLFYDNDNDGIQAGANETGIAGVTVQLLDAAGNIVATTMTDSNGDYVFDDLFPGDYRVLIPTPPSDAPMSSTTTNSNDDIVDGDDNGDQPSGFGAPTISPVITLAVGTEPTSEPGQGNGLGTADDDDGNMTVDFGFVPPLSLGSTLFYDNDNDGIQAGADETGIAGITVELHDTAGNVIATTTTDANGNYLFDELLPGDYQVVVPTPPTDAPTSSTPTNMADDNKDGDDNGDQPGGAGTATTSPVITLAVDSEPTAETEQGGTQDAADDDNGDMTVDFGFAPYVSLGSTIFHDNDNNGMQDSGDAGIAGVTVELYDDMGNLVGTTTTDSNGDYLFDELLPGDYQVVIPTAPADAPVSSQTTSMTDDNMDGDDNGDQPGGAGTVTTSPVITLHADSEPLGEPDQGGVQDAADDDNGDMTVDFGFFEPVSVGDTVWYDDNDNGEQDANETGVAGVIVNLFDSAGNPVTDVNGNPVGPTTTDANGNYLFEDLPPGDYYVEFDLSTLPGPECYVGKQDESGVADDEDSDADPTSGQTGTTPFLNSGEEDITLDMGIVAPVTVGDTVWYDDNRDGIQDAGETGVENVLATLYDTTTGQPVTDQFGVPMVDLTDADGNYLFENLPPGDYYVEFQLSTLPAGYVVTQANQGSDDALDSDADPSTGVTAPTGFLPSNTEDLTLDMGIYRPEGVSVGDRVWLDGNRDGLQDPGEAGVPGVTVTLLDSAGNPVTQDRDGNPITPQTTDSNGNYLFDNLPPGDYAVVFDLTTLPANHLVTPQDAGSDDLLDSDVDPATGMTPSTGMLDEDEQDLSLDLGIYPAGDVTVGDTVWYDDDHDGIQDAGEAGVAGVTVELFDAAGNSVTDMNGNPVGPTTTDANGNYLFEELPAGDYYVEFDLSSLPVGYVPTLQDSSSNDADDSDADPTSGQTASTGFLNDGEEDLTLDMGIVAPISVGDTVWYDNDGDGMQDAGEQGVAGVTVEIFDANGNPVTDMNGNPVGPVVTDSNGNYVFDNLPPGDYMVQFDLSTLPGGYVPTAPNAGGNDEADSDASPSTGATPSTGFLPSGSEDMSLDMGIVQLEGVRVGDLVWYDDNRDGVQDPGEDGVEGVTVNLFNADGTPVTDMNGNPVGPTTTDANGNYLFDNLPPGDYYVQFDLSTLPSGSIITQQDAGSDDAVDSDADLTTGESATTGALAAGEEDLTLDMGIYIPASIGDTVWEDLNADGVQDAGEPGIAGVTVELYDAAGNLVGTTTTDANGQQSGSGNYLFDDLLPGDYYVQFTAPAGYNPSPQDAGGDDAVDSDADPITGQTAVTTLSSGENDPTWDAGFYQPLPGMVRVGDYVWYDDDVDGVQDAGEDGVEGVTVELFNASPGTGPGSPVTDLDGNPVGPTVTDADGLYIFDNLPEGDYYVQFDLATLPAGSLVTLQDAGSDDAADSDADPTTGETATTGDLVDGEEDLTLDMGIYIPASIGDTVWEDTNADGIQDAGEPGIAGVTVELYDAAGSLVGTTTTDANGNYIFDDLLPGDYYVEFTAPAGYNPSPQDAGGDDTVDSDADPITGQTAVTTLRSGENDPTWDAGFYQPDPDATPTPEPTVTEEPTEEPSETPLPVTPTPTPMPEEVQVGDRVWYDNDGDGVQDSPADEPGVEGVTVTLYRADGTLVTDLNGNVVAPVMTDADGNYLFDNLPEGDYYVDFDLNTLPAGYQVTEQDEGGDDGADSDADPTTGHSGTTGFLPEGTEDLTLDLGIVAPVTVGDRVWYDYDGDGVQDTPADEPGVEGVTVLLLNADGTPATDMNGNPVAPVETDADGNYLFENLLPGDYQVMFDLDTLPASHMVTERNATNDQSPATSDQLDSDGDPATGLTDPTGMLMAGEEDLTLDLGILPIPPVEVGDTVWYDEDGDGIQDAGEEGVEGVTVMLFNADGSPVTDMAGNPVGSAVTDSDGNYLFDNLPAGDYVVQFDLTTLPEGYEVTEQDAGSDDGADSDGDPETGQTAPTGFLPAGSSDMSLDLGISPVQPVSVGDRVWYDDDRDGIQDSVADEPGVENVTVTLFNADGTPVTDMDGNPVGPTTTDSDGEYLFENLPPGDYFVQFDLATLPQHYVVTEANAGSDGADSDSADSDANTSTGATDTTGFLPGGSEDLTLDMGIILIDPDVRVGDRVWLDENRDGIQDAGEPGVEGISVNLYDTTTGDLIGTTATDADGNYLFDELFPGDYYVQFDLSTLPDNHVVTLQDSGDDDGADSDADPTDGISGTTGILFTGEEDMSLDMGIYPLDSVTVGDLVWYDSDDDGIQDAGELGVEGVSVMLYDTTTGQPVDGVPSQQTDSNGNYLFEDLPSGDYYVVFDLDTLPDGYEVTAPNAGDDAQDSDVNPANGATGPTGLLFGSEENLTLDMGIVQQPGVTVGDLVWYDDNADGIQDPAEEGVAGVTVYLYDETTGQRVTDEAGEPLMQVTDGDGEYLFTDLPPGQYSVQFDLGTLPEAYVVSPVDQDASDTADSDAGADGRTPPTDVLASGEEDRTLDMGIYKPVKVGDTVWFDVTVHLPPPDLTGAIF